MGECCVSLSFASNLFNQSRCWRQGSVSVWLANTNWACSSKLYKSIYTGFKWTRCRLATVELHLLKWMKLMKASVTRDNFLSLVLCLRNETGNKVYIQPMPILLGCLSPEVLLWQRTAGSSLSTNVGAAPSVSNRVKLFDLFQGPKSIISVSDPFFVCSIL